MGNVYAFLRGIMSIVISWVKANGLTGIGFGLAGLYYLSVGNLLFAGVGFGVFGTRNWDWILDQLKTFAQYIGLISPKKE